MEEDTMSTQETPALSLTHSHQAQRCCLGLGEEGWSGSCQHTRECLWTLPLRAGLLLPLMAQLRDREQDREQSCWQRALLPRAPPALTSQLALPPLPHRCSRRVCGEKEQAEATP